MDSFLDSVKTPAWWLGVVLVGILINLASAYVNPAFERLLGFVLRSYRKRSEVATQLYQAEQAKLRGSSDIRAEYRQRATILLVQAVLFFIWALFMTFVLGLQHFMPDLNAKLSVPSTLVMLSGVVLTLLSAQAFIRAHLILLKVGEAERDEI